MASLLQITTESYLQIAASLLQITAQKYYINLLQNTAVQISPNC